MRMPTLLVACLLFAGSASAEFQRIAVAGGDLAEIAYALGAGDRIVAVDVTSNHPPEARDKPQIGYVRRLAPEGILALSPDMLLAAHDAGPESTMERLAAAGLEIARAPQAESVDGVPEKIEFVGDALGLQAEARAMAEDYRARLASARQDIAGLPAAPPTLFVLSTQGPAPMVAGSETSAAEMLAEAGAPNVAGDLDGWKPMSAEALIASAPQVVLMMEGHANRAGGVDEILDRPDIAATPAGRSRRAVIMDGMLLLGFGPRTPDAIRALAAALRE
ncbi:MAG: ABC transporter substrate-binding protein [Pseudomonadota bacterium]